MELFPWTRVAPVVPQAVQPRSASVNSGSFAHLYWLGERFPQGWSWQAVPRSDSARSKFSSADVPNSGNDISRHSSAEHS